MFVLCMQWLLLHCPVVMCIVVFYKIICIQFYTFYTINCLRVTLFPFNLDFYTPRKELRRVYCFWPVRQSVSPVFLVSATPLKPLDRISWNFVVIKDIIRRSAYPQKILIPFFFSDLRPFLTSKFDENERYNWYSWSAQLYWNRSTELRETL